MRVPSPAMIVPCQEGRVPIVETEDLLQYATALRGPFECEARTALR